MSRTIRHIIVVFVAALILATTALARPTSNRQLAWQVSRAVFGSHASVAYCIAGYETGHTYSPYAVSSTDDHGEWQIHRGLETYGKQIYNIWFNARVAYRMSHGGTNWRPWTTHSYCGV